MTDRWRILVAGVGGQGVLSAGRWLGEAAAASGLPMLVAEQHGLSQRGGSVSCEVAIGGALSPDIPDGMADILVALEPMEAVRVLAKVSARTAALVNTRPLLPVSLQSTSRPYPALESLLEPLAAAVGSLVSTDATALAEQAGSARALNVVMLGMLAGSGRLPLAADRLREVIRAAAPPALSAINERAFRLGAEAVRRIDTR